MTDTEKLTNYLLQRLSPFGVSAYDEYLIEQIVALSIHWMQIYYHKNDVEENWNGGLQE